MAVATLDYEKARILMDANTEVEQSFRIHACEKEPWTVDFIESIDPTTGVFYDIGANVGSYSLIAASRGIRTVAIEPSFVNYHGLVRNAMYNPPDQSGPPFLELITPIPFAVADVQGVAWFDYHKMDAGAASHILGQTRRQFNQRQRMPVLSLDELIDIFGLPAPTHIKIDTDGSEGAVLRGAEGALKGETLVGLMVEVKRKDEADIVGYMNARGWKMAERFDKRGDALIADVLYGRFCRAGESE